jgi:hypothetical protein
MKVIRFRYVCRWDGRYWMVVFRAPSVLPPRIRENHRLLSRLYADHQAGRISYRDAMRAIHAFCNEQSQEATNDHP